MKNSLPFTDNIKSLPIFPHLTSICKALKASPSRFLILTAETAAGKSTALPLALLNSFEGGILMLEPRRLAVLHIAQRVSSLLNEDVGKTCGYLMHLKGKVSEHTRFTVVTEAILTKKIQADPFLNGISVVVIDEFHERSVHADIALAFLKEAVLLRDDLYVVVMSATIDTEKLSSYLGCEVYRVQGRQFPIQIEYKGNLSVFEAIREEWYSLHAKGSILVFLPGLKEIKRVQIELVQTEPNIPVSILHSSVPFEEQKAILYPAQTGTERSVILSSAIAETSVTVPNVYTVIDSGLARLSVFNQNLSLETLETEVESYFNAEQRAGRAGRLGEGRCIRLWLPSEMRASSSVPEILRTDLSSVVLECAEWGTVERDAISWLDTPPITAWNTAKTMLEDLGCIKDGKISVLGQSVLSLGIHPRFACVALSGIPFSMQEFSTKLAIDCMCKTQGTDKNYQTELLVLQKRVQNCISNIKKSTSFQQQNAKFSTQYALLCGFPDRIAVLKENEAEPVYQLATGQEVFLVQGASYTKYIVVLSLESIGNSLRVGQYEALDEKYAEHFMATRSITEERKVFNIQTQTVQKTECVLYKNIILSKKNIPATDEDYKEALCECIAKNGLQSVPISKGTELFLTRVQFYIQETGESGNLAFKYENLLSEAQEWLVPFIPPKEKVSEKAVYEALFFYLDGNTVQKMVPTEIQLENGKKCKVFYEKQGQKIVPFIEIIIQQIFGCTETPKILGFPVVLKLLSPARRPLQITSDLAHFWKETWPQICSEMKGRYPKHNWDATF